MEENKEVEQWVKDAFNKAMGGALFYGKYIEEMNRDEISDLIFFLAKREEERMRNSFDTLPSWLMK